MESLLPRLIFKIPNLGYYYLNICQERSNLCFLQVRKSKEMDESIDDVQETRTIAIPLKDSHEDVSFCFKSVHNFKNRSLLFLSEEIWEY